MAEISVIDLWNPDLLRVSLGLKKKKLKSTKFTGELPRFVKREVRRKALTESTKTVIQKCKGAVLLMLDEAQTLELEQSPEQKHMITDVLNAIHNSKMEKPVILLAAGLGRTKEVFRTFGISQFHSDAFVELGPLEKEAEAQVIRDWLTKEGGA